MLTATPSPSVEVEQGIAAVRRFNRFYTQRIGLLQAGWAKSPFSLAEARVLYELLRRDKPTAGEIAKELGLDAGYLSRILRGFERRGLITKQPSPNDRRQALLSLTARGHKAFAPLEASTRADVEALLDPLLEAERSRLIEAMETVEGLLGGRTPDAAADKSYVLRPHTTGDMGWVVSRHAELYRREYGWNEEI